MSGAVRSQSDGIIVPMPAAVPSSASAQQTASDPASSVWVGASAGSGKTKVLADRVIRLLLSGVPPQRILCLTFTRAAAAEMAIRITQQLKAWAVCADDTLREDLDRLQGHAPEAVQLVVARRLFAQVLQCPGGMRIRTLHAFAQEILRRFPLEAGVAPHFAVMEEGEARAVWREALDELLLKACAAPQSVLGKALTVLVRDRQEAGVNDILREATQDPQRLNAAIAGAGGLEELIARMRGLLGLESDDSEKTLRDSAADERNFSAAAIRAAAVIVQEEGSKTFKERATRMLDWLAASPASRRGGFPDYSRTFLTKEGTIYKSLLNEPLKKKYPKVAETLSCEAARLLAVAERFDSLSVVTQTAALLTLATALNEAYAARKAAQGAMDYGDLISRADALLHRPEIAPWVLYKLDGGIDHMLVDEAQDTSPQQWRIAQILTDEFFAGTTARSDRERTLFVVGDEKQSIFSFQGADVAAFEAMRGYFATHIRAADKPFQEVSLNISFRSAPAILKAVDAIFASDLVRQGVARETVAHEPFWRDAAGRVELWPLLVAEPSAEQTGMEWALPVGYETTQDPAFELAALLARRIRDWCATGLPVYDRAVRQYRPVTPGDIMVLVQRRGQFVNHLVRALKALQVPVSGVDRMMLTAQLAVMDLTALLQFVLLPQDDLTLATVLRGPLLGCGEEQLMALAIGRAGSLWQSLNDKAEDDAGFAAMRDYLRRWLNEADQATPFAMLAGVLSQPCPSDSQSGRRALWKRLGPDAQDPIDEMLNAAQDFGTRHTPSLQAFLHWLLETETEIKRELDQGAGQVRITTVHASKGLQAPIVILPDTTLVPETNRLPKILWHAAQDVPFYVPSAPANAMLRDLRGAAREKQLEEYRRLLYVALTRAADRLYICGWKNKPKKNKEGEEGGETEDAKPDAETANASWYDIARDALTPLHDPAAVVEHADMPPLALLADPAYGVAATRMAAKDSGVPDQSLPDWALRPPPAEAASLRRVQPSEGGAMLEPSLASPIADAEGKRRFARGRLIHRLLQSLPDVAPEHQEAVAARFLANPQHDLEPAAQDEVFQEVMKLLRHPDYAALFAAGSRAEVPIIGYTEDREIPGQVDRLCVREGEVWIVDYKTNRPPPATLDGVPLIYRRQMGAYAAVLRKIYPEKSVRCFLLWTYGPLFMELPQEFLPAP